MTRTLARKRPLPWFETPDAIEPVSPGRPEKIAAWSFLLAAPLAVLLFARDVEPWAFMWLLAFAIFFGCKWLTWWPARKQMSSTRALGYLFAWPGMDARPFANIPPCEAPAVVPPPPAGGGRGRGQVAQREWLAASFKTLLGATLIWFLAHRIPSPFGTWAGMAGILLVLHFGVFHLLALLWRRVGVSVEPIMRAPALATSLADFWSARWNLAFRALAHDTVLRPLQRRIGLNAALFAVYLASGLVHELVISLPARAGYGLPTLYFLLQWLGLNIERSHLGRRAGLQHGLAGRAFMLLLTAGPMYWLFHPAFVQRVIVPFFQDIRAL
jgi:hypothetical protein